MASQCLSGPQYRRIRTLTLALCGLEQCGYLADTPKRSGLATQGCSWLWTTWTCQGRWVCFLPISHHGCAWCKRKPQARLVWLAPVDRLRLLAKATKLQRLNTCGRRVLLILLPLHSLALVSHIISMIYHPWCILWISKSTPAATQGSRWSQNSKAAFSPRPLTFTAVASSKGGKANQASDCKRSPWLQARTASSFNQLWHHCPLSHPPQERAPWAMVLR